MYIQRCCTETLSYPHDVHNRVTLPGRVLPISSIRLFVYHNFIRPHRARHGRFLLHREWEERENGEWERQKYRQRRRETEVLTLRVFAPATLLQYPPTHTYHTPHCTQVATHAGVGWFSNPSSLVPRPSSLVPRPSSHPHQRPRTHDLSVLPPKQRFLQPRPVMLVDEAGPKDIQRAALPAF